MFIHRYKNYMILATLLLIIGGLSIGGVYKTFFLVIATIIAGLPIAIKAYQALRFKAFSIELLVTIAVVGALIIGEYVESAVVTFLFLFGDFLEGRTLAKTRSSLRELTDMAPQEANVIRDGVQHTIHVDEVLVGDRVLIHPGGKIPVDGSIVKGEASVNESAITGESVPVNKSIEEDVFSGTIVDNGYIEMIADKIGDDTTFAQIIELVEEAQESQTKTEKFLNKFATYYTPTIALLSVLVYILTKDAHIAITFLVIACPGALVIGVPVSTVSGIGNGAKNGVLIKGGEVMDNFSKVNMVVFDKTGTLTKGQPTVTDFQVFDESSKETLFTLVANAEKFSEHHLGKTIVKKAEEKVCHLNYEVTESDMVKGHGLRATVDEHRLVVGNRKLMEKENINIPAEVESYAMIREKKGNTAIFVALDHRVSGVISIADEIREDAKQAVTALRQQGVGQIIMLTGDNEHTAKIVAETLGLDDYYAELLPEDKVNYVKQWKEAGYHIAMAGDGINDAPAIASADIGIAMGEGGTDVSMETADVVLMADKLKQFTHAFSLSKVTIRNMKQNTIFAVATVLFLLIGVLKGEVHLASGMFIHEASVLLVIFNGMRLLTFKERQPACSEQEMPDNHETKQMDIWQKGA